MVSRVIVITGSTGGLGRAAAEACLGAGARVVISSESESDVASTLSILGGESDVLTGITCDVTVPEQVDALRTHAVATFGRIDCWINNAGISAPSGHAALVPRRMGEALIRINTLGTYYGSVVALRQFRQQGSGRLINVTGRGEKGAVKGAGLYSASKSWLRTFTLSLAEDEESADISVHTFNPGMMYTELTARPRVLRGNEDAQLKGLKMVMPLIGDPPEKAGESLASYALETDLKSRELTHRSLLPLVLKRLLTGQRAEDIAAIEPQISEPEN